MAIANEFGLQDYVTSFTLVWIKISMPSTSSATAAVTSFTLVWIKISSIHPGIATL